VPRYTYHNQQHDFQGQAIGLPDVYTNASAAQKIAGLHVYCDPTIMHIRISRCLEHTYEFKPYAIVYMNIVTDKPVASRRKVF
jgi:hypothetical protein